MGWVSKEPIPHGCTVPPPKECEGMGAGSIWRCEECGTRWEVITHGGWNWRSIGRSKPLDVSGVDQSAFQPKPRKHLWQWLT